MRLRITNYSKQPNLQEAIRRYYTLLRLGFDRSGIYKLFETVSSQISRFVAAPSAPSAPLPPMQEGEKKTRDEIKIEVECPKCRSKYTLQANLERSQVLKKGLHPFPKDNNFMCPNCGALCNLTPIRDQLEAQTKKKMMSPKQRKKESQQEAMS